jgi:hypothetical protein
MRRLSTMIAATAAIGAALAAPAFAQPLAMGDTVSGALAEGDARNDGREAWMDTYQLTLGEGQSVRLDMTSDEGMDTYLLIGVQSDGYFEEYASNDDRGDGTLNSRLTFTAPFAGEYTIQATSFGADTVGPYTLSAAEAIVTPPPTPRALSVGGSVSGEFTSASPVLEWSSQPYDLFTYEADAGEIVVFTMNSDAFDSYLEVGQDYEWGFEPMMSDDDSGGNLNARLVYRFPEAGAYTVRAMGLYESSTGPFTVAAESFPQPAEPRPTPIRMNQIMRGSLDEGEVINDYMQYYDLYSLRVRQGQEVRITMRSETLDSVLEVGVMSPAGFAVAAYDDDSGGGIYGLDAQVSFTAEQSGTLIIRAQSLSPMTPGEYTISVE